jgi:hypothetical protein
MFVNKRIELNFDTQLTARMQQPIHCYIPIKHAWWYELTFRTVKGTLEQPRYTEQEELEIRLWSPECAVRPHNYSVYFAINGSVTWQRPSRKEAKPSSWHETPTVLSHFLTGKISSSSAPQSLYCLCMESLSEKCQTASRYGSQVIMEAFSLFKIFRHNFSSARTRLATDNRTNHEELAVAWLPQKFPVIHWTQSFTFAFTTAGCSSWLSPENH